MYVVETWGMYPPLYSTTVCDVFVQPVLDRTRDVTRVLASCAPEEPETDGHSRISASFWLARQRKRRRRWRRGRSVSARRRKNAKKRKECLVRKHRVHVEHYIHDRTLKERIYLFMIRDPVSSKRKRAKRKRSNFFTFYVTIAGFWLRLLRFTVKLLSCLLYVIMTTTSSEAFW